MDCLAPQHMLCGGSLWLKMVNIKPPDSKKKSLLIQFLAETGLPHLPLLASGDESCSSYEEKQHICRDLDTRQLADLFCIILVEPFLSFKKNDAAILS